ncbi:hypothetical protein MPNTM1_03920 [Mycolicibacterium parafortuitum]|uniref:hypothetical protein n=1 Tax=Mycolicibacterium parafortuitum TaxID=39692 RepID=UPI000CF28C9E|nr:hypothetical protein CYL16_02500 [Mycobacterium sp. EPG1]
MTKPDGTPDRTPFDDVPEADVAEQRTPIDDTDDEVWDGASPRIDVDRDWQASEADLIEQAIPVPEDDTEFDR